MAWDYLKQAVFKQKKADPIWYLERQINYGEQGKLDEDLVKKHLSLLHISEDKRKALELLLWDKPF